MNGPPLNIPLLLRTATSWRVIGTALLLVAGFTAMASAAVSLELELGRQSAYPGESVPVTVTLRVTDARVRNIGYPRLAAPAGSAVAFASPVQGTDASDPHGALYRFSGRISSTKPGQFSVGPASLDLEMMEAARGSDAFFGAVEPRPLSLATKPVAFDVLPLPAVGRPASFSGAIGTFSMAISTKPARIAVGAPLTITTTISGTGNLDGASCPQITGENIRSYPPTARRGDGSLVCEQVMVQKLASSLPSVLWSYFDPGQRRYLTISKALPTVVIPPRQEGRVQVDRPAAASSPPAQSPLRERFVMASLVAICGLAVAASMTRVLRRRYLPEPSPKRTAAAPPKLTDSLALLEQALAADDVENFYKILFAILQHVVGTANSLPAQGVTGVIPDGPDGSSTESAPLTQLFAQCDRIRFGRFVPGHIDMQSDLTLLRSFLRSRALIP